MSSHAKVLIFFDLARLCSNLKNKIGTVLKRCHATINQECYMVDVSVFGFSEALYSDMALALLLSGGLTTL